MQDSNHHEPAAAGDIRAMADPDAVMSPLPGLVSKPCGLRAPHSFRYGLSRFAGPLAGLKNSKG
jgi:hypothetical protein